MKRLPTCRTDEELYPAKRDARLRRERRERIEQRQAARVEQNRLAADAARESSGPVVLKGEVPAIIVSTYRDPSGLKANAYYNIPPPQLGIN